MLSKARPGADPVKARAADPEYVQVESFLEAISQRRLASASFHCGAYARHGCQMAIAKFLDCICLALRA